MVKARLSVSGVNSLFHLAHNCSICMINGQLDKENISVLAVTSIMYRKLTPYVARKRQIKEMYIEMWQLHNEKVCLGLPSAESVHNGQFYIKVLLTHFALGMVNLDPLSPSMITACHLHQFQPIMLSPQVLLFHDLLGLQNKLGWVVNNLKGQRFTHLEVLCITLMSRIFSLENLFAPVIRKPTTCTMTCETILLGVLIHRTILSL